MAAVIPAVVIGAAVAEELPKFFSDAFDQFAAGEGIYLRDGEPEGVVAKVGQAVGRAYCRAYNNVADEYEPGKAVRIEKACRPYLNSIGGSGGPGIVQPFTGGQCPGVGYNVRGFYTPINLDGSPQNPIEWQRNGLLGPIRGVSIENRNPNNPQAESVVLSYGPNLEIILASGNTCPNGCFKDAVIAQVTRASGLPDNCGDPPLVPTIPPRGAPIQPPPFRFNPDPGLDINIDIDINPDGTFNFNIGTGPITVDPFPPPSDGPGGGGEPGEPAPNPDGPPGDVGSPGAPQEPGPGGEASGCAPEGQVLTGIKVDFVEIPVDAKQYAEGIYRAVCYAYLGTQTGLDHDPAGAMMRSGQFIFAEKSNLTCWAVRANLGWSLRTTPYYRELEE